jgi:hypothetical protein
MFRYKTDPERAPIYEDRIARHQEALLQAIACGILTANKFTMQSLKHDRMVTAVYITHLFLPDEQEIRTNTTIHSAIQVNRYPHSSNQSPLSFGQIFLTAGTF